ncbi:MAG: arsenate reductase ArsC [Clostridia bacterium]|nr:arsenate reductase ArsC [Clostridia bacterium]
MLKVLFVCVHNSARSQMAQEFLNDLGKGKFIAESAGLEPGVLNPRVVQVMQEIGYDISGNPCNSAFDFFKQDRRYDLVITVCDQASGQRCPVFPSAKATLNWSFEDPSSLIGSEAEVLQQTRKIRDQIKTRIEEFIRVYNVG